MTHLFPFLFLEFLIREKNIKIALDLIPKKIKIKNVNFSLSFIVIFIPIVEHFMCVTLNDDLFFLYDDCSAKVLVLNKEYKVNPQCAFYIKEN